MLKLTNVTKVFEMGDYSVRALRGISLAFRQSEFVSIIGASGCGKSTLLNIIGGLDRYTTGNLVIGNTSTKDFKSEQWDAYRNATIGFVFQNYNLIPHLTVLENVELALSLSGVEKGERRKMAIAALERVGMGDELKKKPSQISGGQMQRVAIARALVNNPKIVLADEPTGALDSKLSVQVMELLQEVAKDRLVIMVTHNNELADTYSTRIVKLRDGLVESDTNPYEWEPETDSEKAADEAIEKPGAADEAKDKSSSAKILNALGIKQRGQKSPFKATSMKATTAFSLSLKNLLTKKRRTFLTSFAGSVGIISLALVLAMSNGFNVMLDSMQASVLASVPIGIYEYSMDYSVLTDVFQNYDFDPNTYPEEDNIYFTELNSGSAMGTGGSFDLGGILDSVRNSVGRNNITEEYVNYVKNMDPSLYYSINYFYGTKMNILSYQKDENGQMVYSDVSPEPQTTNAWTIAGQVLGSNGQEPVNWFQLAGDEEFVLSNYDLIGGRYPNSYNEIVLVINGDNKIGPEALIQFGVDVYERDQDGNIIKDSKGNPKIRESISFDEILYDEERAQTGENGLNLKLVDNDTYYYQSGENNFKVREPSAELYNNTDNVSLKLVGILRLKPNGNGFVGNALCYTPELAEHVLESAKTSQVTLAQQALMEQNPQTSDCVIVGDSYFDGKIGTDNDSIGGLIFDGLGKTAKLKALGIDTTPIYMTIYPVNFDAKNEVTAYLNDWNDSHPDETVEYFDVTEMFIANMRIMVDLMTTVLIAVASISLIVSCIMIAIITGNSVVERTREIGILRSLGARKRDISRVFDAETAIIGLCAGVLGIIIAYALVPLANLLIGTNLLVLNPLHAVLLVLLSLGLTVLSGLVPSQAASRKNVVDALRIE